MTIEEAKKRIQRAIRKYARAVSGKDYELVPLTLKNGKVYEAHVLSKVLESLSDDEGMTIKLIKGEEIWLRGKGGPINRDFPYFELWRGGQRIAELWNDIYFVSLSHTLRGRLTNPEPGEYHELDIVVTDPGLSSMPYHDQIWLGIECKYTDYEKNLLREILGVRRELSLLTDNEDTRLRHWPRRQVKAKPASCLMVYSNSPSVEGYDKYPGPEFGIDFRYEPVTLPPDPSKRKR